MVGIVLLAMVAAFLALRLYMVLGKRSGHEQALPPKPAEERLAPAPQLRAVAEPVSEAPHAADSVIDAGATSGVRAVLSADSSFDVARFLDGAKAAYRMILEAFWKGDEEELSWLVSADVREAFAAAIAARREAGHTLDNRLVSIEGARIEAARLEGRTAFLTVHFVADIAAVTRDAEGNVVAGTLTDAVATNDSWTFSRNLKDSDPNWLLVETDEAQ
ncbi:Tim44/TimA family putative adaptor protein [Sphingomonas sp. MAH-20]|uniref:Tim44/TimA family putative adaptor protein n=1 Tax=Sphingomonas horti TaxID=2682842 RepID=A0A6I4J103_9SPHN|nr:Tim44/TimA family putative adaptor protein [Sphingomonas sp. CGMCC 1.13658]MBA2919378.1 Tim44 domain-containing protein [Sphingomonas sp. CGMCC 1.13658]MVO78259.1 Tim44/TimA family putative adaptor protein [Sphingomonas horti]